MLAEEIASLRSGWCRFLAQNKSEVIVTTGREERDTSWKRRKSDAVKVTKWTCKAAKWKNGVTNGNVRRQSGFLLLGYFVKVQNCFVAVGYDFVGVQNGFKVQNHFSRMQYDFQEVGKGWGGLFQEYSLRCASSIWGVTICYVFFVLSGLEKMR